MMKLKRVWRRRRKLHKHIIRTESISYPRSGHGALYHTLKRYFGDQFNYCAPLPQPNHCGCDSVLCTNVKTHFSKNHDFDVYKNGGIEIKPEQQYLIQFRNPVRSIVSNYYLYLAKNPHKASKEEWVAFAHKGIVYWNKLIDKWVIESQHQSKLLMSCPYEQFVTHPRHTVSQIITFMTDEEPDVKQLQQAITQVNIRPLNRIVTFPFFDKGFFREIEELAEPRLEMLALPSFKDSV